MTYSKRKITFISVICITVIVLLIIIYRAIKPSNAVSLHDLTKYSIDITGDSDTSFSFQKMVDSFPQGTTINLPKGKYKLSHPVTLRDKIKITSSEGATFIGTGKNCLFNVGNSNTFDGIQFQNCSVAINASRKSDLNVLNCRFANNIAYAAINFTNSTSSSIKNSYFYNILKYGILIDNDSSDILIDNNNFDNPKIFGGYSKEQIGGHIYCLNGSKITVTNNILKNSGGQGVIFCFNSSTNKGTTNSIASNNFCEGNGQEGATIYGGNNKVSGKNSIIGNTCRNNRFNQIEVWQATNCTIKNNLIEESAPDTGNLGAICLYSVTQTTCTENNILSSQSNGIDITAGSSNCVISKNKISNTNGKNDISTPEKGNGILLDSNGISQPEYITITDNTIKSSKGIINKSGIYSTSNTNHHNKIYNNSISDYKYDIHIYAKMTCN